MRVVLVALLLSCGCVKERNRADLGVESDAQCITIENSKGDDVALCMRGRNLRVCSIGEDTQCMTIPLDPPTAEVQP